MYPSKMYTQWVLPIRTAYGFFKNVEEKRFTAKFWDECRELM